MGVPSISGDVSAVCGEPMSLDLYMYSIDFRVSAIGADWYCRFLLRLLRRKKASEMRAIRTMAPATAPPISAPRWFDDGDDDAGAEAGEAVCMTMFVVVMRPPLAEVTTETMETILTSLVGDGFAAAPPPAFFVAEEEVDAEVDVVVGVVEVDDDADVLDVVSPLPSRLPMMLAEATAGPAVLMEATETPLGSGKKSLESVLSQQTLDALRL